MVRRQAWRWQDRRVADAPATGQRIQLDVLAVLRRWRTLAVLGALGLVLGLVVTSLLSVGYRATAVFFVGGSTDATGGPVYADLDAEVQAQLDALGSAAVARRAADRLGEPAVVSIRRLGPDSAAIRIDGEADSPERAVEVVDAYLAAFADAEVAQEVAGIERVQAFLAERIDATEEELARLLTAEGGSRSPGGVVAALEGQLRRYIYDLQSLQDRAAFLSASPVSMLDPPKASDEALGRPFTRNAALGGLLGVIIGVLVVLARRDAGWTFETSGELEGLTGLPVLGTVPAASRRPLPGGRWVARDPAAGWAFAEMRSVLRAAYADRSPVVLQVTSARPGEGVTTVVENLGVTFAAAGSRVLLVDLNLRRPRLHRRFGVPLGPGFGDLVGPDPAAGGPSGMQSGATVRHVAANIDVLGAGASPVRSGGLLASARAGEVLQELVDDYDVVLVDSPPVLGVADAREVAGLADGTVVVVSRRTTGPHELADAVEAVAAVEAEVLGLVVNRRGGPTQRWSPRRHAVLPRLAAALTSRSR